jgi:hypothetical protein
MLFTNLNIKIYETIILHEWACHSEGFEFVDFSAHRLKTMLVLVTPYGMIMRVSLLSVTWTIISSLKCY